MKSYRDSSSYFNQHRSDLVKPTYGGSVWRPKWNKEAKVETHFRPTGPLLEDKTNFLPWRIDAARDGFGEWFLKVPIFKGGTANFRTFISQLEDPDHPGELDERRKSPADKFREGVYKMAKADAELERQLCKGGSGKGAAVPKKTKPCGLIQGIMLRNGEKEYYTRPHMPAILQLSESASDALAEFLEAKDPNFNGDRSSFDQFLSGDVLDANAGTIFSFYCANVVDPGAAKVDWDKAGEPENKREKRASDFSSYACESRGPLPLPRNPDGTLRNSEKYFTPWEEILQLLTEEQMVNVLCDAYSDIPDILLATLREYNDMLPRFVKGGATVTVDGNAQQPTARPVAATRPAAAAAATPAAKPRPVQTAPAVNWDAPVGGDEVGDEDGADQGGGGEAEAAEPLGLTPEAMAAFGKPEPEPAAAAAAATAESRAAVVAKMHEMAAKARKMAEKK